MQVHLTPLLALIMLLILPGSSHAQAVPVSSSPQEASARETKDGDGRRICATVDGVEVSAGAARQLLMKSVPYDQRAFENPMLMNVAVNQLVDRHVVYDYLAQQKKAVGKSEIRLERDTFENELGKYEQTIEGYLAETGQLPSELELEIAWSIAWQRYLKRRLTDDFLRRYFEDRRREFDNSQMRVAHLLIKPRSEGQPSADEKAKRIYLQLNAGQADWIQAVSEFSDAPTRTTGGELGWISYHQPMPRKFSEAAFRLQVDEISPPTTTRFGVHLIKCLEIKEGKTGWRDALDKVRQAATRAEFENLARQHRPNLDIQFRPGFSEIATDRND